MRGGNFGTKHPQYVSYALIMCLTYYFQLQQHFAVITEVGRGRKC